LPVEERRVALALHPAGGGPFIVVTRDGNFVTALGAEMTPKNTTILSRAQVDAFSARVEDARARLELAKDLVPPGKQPEDVMRLLMTRPWGLSREEFSAIAAWVPLFAGRFYREAVEHLTDMDDVRTKFLTQPPKTRRSLPRARSAMELVWNTTHGIGARFALAAMGDLAWAERLADAWQSDAGPTFFATRERVHSVAMRGAWAAARMGRPFIPLYKRLLGTPGNLFVRFDAALAMTAIGLRHARHRDEARRIVGTMVGSADDWNLEWTREIVRASEEAFEDPEGALKGVAEHGAEILVASAADFAEGSTFRFTRAQDVPRDLALLVAANGAHESVSPFALQSLPWVAKLESAEELYYPEELERALRVDWTLDLIEQVYARGLPEKPKPATRAGPALGRNDPCSCGSGAKFKRCCGR
jgi:hypothetical protein